jgi:hypothetical protein
MDGLCFGHKDQTYPKKPAYQQHGGGNTSLGGCTIEAGHCFSQVSASRPSCHHLAMVINIIDHNVKTWFPIDWNLTHLLYALEDYCAHYMLSSSR